MIDHLKTKHNTHKWLGLLDPISDPSKQDSLYIGVHYLRQSDILSKL